jgi:pyruvate/2-oxoglutarate dehydrogenase complex dihydrolipoamide dehydrogenase (E3) component
VLRGGVKVTRSCIAGRGLLCYERRMGDAHAEEVDVVVIGLGPGGEEVAERLAEAGLAVVGVEEHLVGGECPYYGCIPSKMMVRGSDLLAEARRVDRIAGRVTVMPDFAPVARRIRAEATDGWNDRAAVERFEKLGGRFVRGGGTLDGPGRVRVGDRVFAARRGVVIATGTSPAVPPIPGLADVPYWTNRDAVKAETAPATLVALGGGAIGVEMSQAFARFGSRVTVIEAEDRLLTYEEPEASAVLAEVLRAEGIDVRTGCKAVRVEAAGDTIVVHTDDGGSAPCARLLVATGRRTNLAGMGLASVGLDERAPTIRVDERCRAGDKLWAVGDITGAGAFTHVAVYQARIAIADILGREGAPADYRALAWVTFTDPEIGRVGMSEAQARGAGLRVRTGSAEVRKTSRGWIHGPGNAGFIKLVEDADRGVLVGATSVGPWGGEVLAVLSLAVHAAVPVRTLRTMHFAFPTFHRGVLEALATLDRGV